MRYFIGLLFLSAALMLWTHASGQTLPNGATVMPVTAEPPPAYASYLMRNAWCDRYLHSRTPVLTSVEYQREFLACVPDPVSYRTRTT